MPLLNKNVLIEHRTFGLNQFRSRYFPLVFPLFMLKEKPGNRDKNQSA
jgi:hypothetical protein